MNTKTWNKGPAAWAARLALGVCIAIAAVMPARAQLDVNGAKQALAAQGDLQRAIGGMQGAMNTRLGPYPVDTSCRFCNREFLGLCLEYASRGLHAEIDFNWTRNQLVGVLNQAQAQTANFANAYAPAKAWVSGLPAFNATFGSAAAAMLKVRDEIGSGQGPNDEQRQRVVQALQVLVTNLGNSGQQLTAGTGALAAYLQQQSRNREQIRYAMSNADQVAAVALKDFTTQTQSWQCRDGVDATIVRVVADFSRSTQQVSASFQQLDASSRAAEQALAAMTGTLVSAQSDYQRVLNLVQATRNDQLGSFIEQMHLDIARRQWQQLADYAVQVQ